MIGVGHQSASISACRLYCLSKYRCTCSNGNMVVLWCRFHRRNISRIRKYIPQDISIVIIKSLVMSRLDYSNGLLYGLPKCTVSGLQAVQNSAARIVTQERLRDHDSMSRALMELHWLPVDKRIEYKLLLYT